MLVNRNDFLSAGNQRNCNRRMAVNDRANVRFRLVQTGVEKNLLRRIAPSSDKLSVEVVLQNFIFRKRVIKGRAQMEQYECIATRGLGAHMSPHVRKLPAENLCGRRQLIFEIV